MELKDSSRWEGVKITLVTVVGLCVILELILRILSSVGVVKLIYVNQEQRKTELYQFDPYTGWRMRPNSNWYVIYKEGRRLEEMNIDGWRDRLYPLEKLKNTFRIGVMGCSFTYGYGADVDQTYPKVLERLFHERKSPNIEVMNFGVNGWGLDQLLLGYKAYVRKYKPDVVLLQYYGDGVLRTAYDEMWATQKPVYVMQDGKPVLRNYPVPKSRFRSADKWLAYNSFLYAFVKDKFLAIYEAKKWYRFLNQAQTLPNDEKLWRLCTEILKLFKQEADKDHVRLIVFVWDRLAAHEKKTCKDAGVEVVDIQDMFPEIDIRSDWRDKSPLHFPAPTMHWNEKGNVHVAESLYKYLEMTVGQEISARTKGVDAQR